MAPVHGKLLSQALASYYNGPDHPMKMRIWSWLRRNLVTGRLLISYCGDGWITVDEADLIQREVLTHGAYELEVWRKLASFAQANEVLWDVGANIGTVTIRACLDPRIAAIHAFEPDPETHEILKKNVVLNRPDKCHIHECALGDAEGERPIMCGPVANRGLSSLCSCVIDTMATVQCTTADELIFGKGVAAPTLLKIDVEGWEQRVLMGASRLFTENPPRAIVFEALANRNGSLLDSEMERRLVGYGYHVVHILRPSGDTEERENYLAVRKTV